MSGKLLPLKVTSVSSRFQHQKSRRRFTAFQGFQLFVFLSVAKKYALEEFSYLERVIVFELFLFVGWESPLHAVYG